MSYSNGHITAPISVYDVQKALGVSSGDVGTLCTHENINIWARYRPIPCVYSQNNTPSPITDAQRQDECYGIDPPIDMYLPSDAIQAYENYVNSLEKNGLYYIQLRPFGDTHWKRITDFVKTNNSGQAVANKGYDHNARPDFVSVIISSGQSYQVGEHHLTPLIPELNRTIVIPPGSTDARYAFPNDHLWMDEYFKYIKGTSTLDIEVTGNDEWLTPMDIMGLTYNSFPSVQRRLVIFQKENGSWVLRNYVTDTDYVETNERPFDGTDHNKAWVDFTDSEQALNTFYDTDIVDMYGNVTPRRLGHLEGTYLFMEAWVEHNNTQNVAPIIGYCYEVNIIRDNIDISLDVYESGVFVLSLRMLYESDYTELGVNYHELELYIDYNVNATSAPSAYGDTVENIVAFLSLHFESLQVSFGSRTTNLLSTSLPYISDASGSGEWASIHAVLLRDYQEDESLQGVIANFTGIRKNNGTSTGITTVKQMTITNNWPS